MTPKCRSHILVYRAGAVGINLTQANRVFLMEPCMNPALESQAVGRVHRLGQKREVETIRLVMKDSVESRLLQYLKRKYGSSVGNRLSAEADAEARAKESTGKSEPSPQKPSAPIVGNIRSDKGEMMLSDFDLLFGVPPMKGETMDVDAGLDSHDEVQADKVSSFSTI